MTSFNQIGVKPHDGNTINQLNKQGRRYNHTLSRGTPRGRPSLNCGGVPSPRISARFSVTRRFERPE